MPPSEFGKSGPSGLPFARRDLANSSWRVPVWNGQIGSGGPAPAGPHKHPCVRTRPTARGSVFEHGS
eukprot:9150485-Lingulodinium_polyedra.AAC.1